MAKKSIKGKTSDELIKDLPSWKATRFRDFWQSLPTGSKQQAVVSYDIASTTVALADEINLAAKNYAKLCQKSERFKKHASTWLNQADWETQGTVKDEIHIDPKFCSCGEPAAHLHPEPLCGKCHADKYSMQKYEGHYVPYKRVLADQLKRMNLVPENGETNESYWNRCRERLRGKLRLDSGRSEGMRQVVTGKGVHGDSEGSS